MPVSANGLGFTYVAGIDPTTGLPSAAKRSYTLLSNATTTGQPVSGIAGGDYVWRIEGTFGGSTATLQMLGLDGSTWVNVRNAANTADVMAAANGSIGVGVGQGATVRVLLSGGTPSAMNSTLAGL